jgi:carbon monoxide dehydrogenase subunit G
MKFDGSVTIRAKQDVVWEFLTDPHLVSQCAPGVKEVEIVIPDKQFRTNVGIALGAVKVNFAMDVEWIELDGPNRAKMRARGNAPGSAAEVEGTMTLSELEPNVIELYWEANVQIMGRIASLAMRLAPGVTKKLVGEFFDCVVSRIEK